ncbi:uncharacterized protein METZ01_LOCUS87489, partial [marine metagenome]
MFRAKSEARKAARLPISSGVCSRFIGIHCSTVCSNTSLPAELPSFKSWPPNLARFLAIDSHIGVQRSPGQI